MDDVTPWDDVDTLSNELRFISSRVSGKLGRDLSPEECMYQYYQLRACKALERQNKILEDISEQLRDGIAVHTQRD